MVGWSSARFDAKDDAPTLSPADRSSVASAPWVARAVTMLQAKFLPKAPVRSMPPSMRPWKSLKLSSVTLVRSGLISVTLVAAAAGVLRPTEATSHRVAIATPALACSQVSSVSCRPPMDDRPAQPSRTK